MKAAPTIHSLFLLNCLAILGGWLWVLPAQGQDDRHKAISERASSTRVRPPEWKPDDAEEVFFRDAFRDALFGSRPPDMTRGTNSAVDASPGDPATTPLAAVQGPAWSAIISAETIEDEIKVLAQQLNQTVTTPAKFASRGYLDARIQFSLLGLLFAIAHEYDGDVRWRNHAATARDRFLQTASITKDGTIEVYHAAKNRKAELDKLVRGGSIGTDSSNDGDGWLQMLDRGPIMERLETADQETIQPALASASALRAAADRLIHEAELIVAIGYVLTREGMEDANNEEYVAYCDQLKRAATDVIQAVRQNDYSAARGAAGEISKSCSNCHESFRD
jgi:hypothetical protein